MISTPLYVRVARATRRHGILVTCIILLGAVAATSAALMIHPKYAATATVLMVAEPNGAENPLAPSTATKPLLSADLPALAIDPTVLHRLHDDLHETVPFAELKAHIRAKLGPDSSILPVTYTANTPEFAIRASNDLADEITRFYRETATTRFDSLIADFSAQLALRRAELTKLDAQVAATAKTYPYIDIKTPGSAMSDANSVYGRLIALRTARDEVAATMVADGAAAQETRRLIADAKPLAERDLINSDGPYQTLRTQLTKDFTDLKRMSAFASDRFPGVAELREIVEREAVLVAKARKEAVAAGVASNATYVAALDAQAKADALYISDIARLNAVSGQLTQLQSQLGVGGISTSAASLRRDHDIAEDAYGTIAGRLAKAIADRAEAASTGSVIVLDHAQFASKTQPIGLMSAAGLMFLAVWLALSLALMIDAHSAWFADAQSVETIYGTKLLGSLA